MTTFLLIRHAMTDVTSNLLSGRMPNVHLSVRGRLSAHSLARQLAKCALAAIWSSPLERAIETAIPLVNATGAALHLSDKLNEVDYGDWTGMTFDALSTDPRWHNFNTYREATRIPSGEIISEVRARVLSLLHTLNTESPLSTIAIVTHAEIIRVVLSYYLGIRDNPHSVLDIIPSSVSIIRVSQRPIVLGINCEGTWLSKRFSYTAES
jgi:broad specificity phosphatase PhoE